MGRAGHARSALRTTVRNRRLNQFEHDYALLKLEDDLEANSNYSAYYMVGIHAGANATSNTGPLVGEVRDWFISRM